MAKSIIRKKTDIIAKNRFLPHKQDIRETYEAGIVLYGPEVKACKTGKASIAGARVTVTNNAAFLAGAIMGPYPPASHTNANPARTRKLLLKTKELRRLAGQANAKGLTLLPLSVYTKNNLIKLSFAVIKRTRTIDRREVIKKRDFERRKQQILKT